MTRGNTPDKVCRDCVAWVKLSDVDGGIGICDNTRSSHNQHLVGHHHPACKQYDAEGADTLISVLQDQIQASAITATKVPADIITASGIQVTVWE